MDPINPIEPRSRWIAELAPAQRRGETLSKTGRREGRKTTRRADPGAEPRHEPPRERDGPDDEGTEGRHVDVRA